MYSLGRLSFVVCVLIFLFGTRSSFAETLSYSDIAKRLYDLRALAVAPITGEQSGSFSSFDRKSRYDPETKRYVQWQANQDGSGSLRREGDGIVAAEIEGPGVIWRVWSGLPGQGHMKVWIDGGEKPVLDLPFADYFQSKSGPFAYPELVQVLSKGHNSYIPIPFQKSCRVVLEKDWGLYYHVTYSKFPPGTNVPSFRGDFNDTERAALAKANEVFARRGEDPKGKLRGETRSTDSTGTLNPGESYDVYTQSGPGAILRFRFLPDFDGEDPSIALRELELRMFWDGETTPSVWVPLGDFFGSAPGVNEFRSLPVGMTGKQFYSYWYLPFRKGAVVRITNSGTRARRFEASIEHQPLGVHSVPELRLHAKWHRDSYAGVEKRRFTHGDRWPDWPVLVTRSAGRFVGMHLHAWNPSPLGRRSNVFEVEPDARSFRIRDTMKQAAFRWWWGEGDEKFFVDGEERPSTFGTGTENYFGAAFGAKNPTKFESALQCQARNRRNRGHISNSRFHIADNVPFSTKFEGCIEKFHSNDSLRYAVTVFWYQRAGDSDLYPSVPVDQRVDYYVQPERHLAVPIPKDGYYDAETHFVRSDDVRVQGMRHFGAGWRGDAHLLWGAKKGDSTTVEFQVKETGKYEVEIQYTQAPDYGIFQAYVDRGQGTEKLGEPADLFSKKVRLAPLSKCGQVQLTKGIHELSFRMIG
ncbi:MAG: DUF2961 domain-containing protein, partial [Planctomycetota bacterium]